MREFPRPARYLANLRFSPVTAKKRRPCKLSPGRGGLPSTAFPLPASPRAPSCSRCLHRVAGFPFYGVGRKGKTSRRIGLTGRRPVTTGRLTVFPHRAGAKPRTVCAGNRVGDCVRRIARRRLLPERLSVAVARPRTRPVRQTDKLSDERKESRRKSLAHLLLMVCCRCRTKTAHMDNRTERNKKHNHNGKDNRNRFRDYQLLRIRI